MKIPTVLALHKINVDKIQKTTSFLGPIWRVTFTARSRLSWRLIKPHSPKRRIPYTPNMFNIHQIETLWMLAHRRRKASLRRTDQFFQRRSRRTEPAEERQCSMFCSFLFCWISVLSVCSDHYNVVWCMVGRGGGQWSWVKWTSPGWTVLTVRASLAVRAATGTRPSSQWRSLTPGKQLGVRHIGDGRRPPSPEWLSHWQIRIEYSLDKREIGMWDIFSKLGNNT